MLYSYTPRMSAKEGPSSTQCVDASKEALQGAKVADANLARPILSVEMANHSLFSFHLLKEAFLAQHFIVLPMPSSQPLLLLLGIQLELEYSLLPQNLNVLTIKIVQGVYLIVYLVLNLLCSGHYVLMDGLLYDICCLHRTKTAVAFFVEKMQSSVEIHPSVRTATSRRNAPLDVDRLVCCPNLLQ